MHYIIYNLVNTVKAYFKLILLTPKYKLIFKLNHIVHLQYLHILNRYYLLLLFHKKYFIPFYYSGYSYSFVFKLLMKIQTILNVIN